MRVFSSTAPGPGSSRARDRSWFCFETKNVPSDALDCARAIYDRQLSELGLPIFHRDDRALTPGYGPPLTSRDMNFSTNSARRLAMAKRKSIHIKGMEHGAPIPNGTVIGNLVFSSAISGKDAKTGVLSPDPDEQAEAMFRNLRLFMESAGGTSDNIAHMKVYLKEERLRDAVNKAWSKMFPDEHDRPARHAIKVELRGDVLFQIEVVAVL